MTTPPISIEACPAQSGPAQLQPYAAIDAYTRAQQLHVHSLTNTELAQALRDLIHGPAESKLSYLAIHEALARLLEKEGERHDTGP